MDLNTGVAKIKVIGVGGGGNNAVNRMVEAQIKSAEFLAVNTDQQALKMSKANKTLVIGMDETHGLGAGADPSVGEKAALSSRDDLREELRGVDLLFITAGMGGGTGTGAAPIIANIANELGILTVAVVTKPFGFEGKRRMLNAERGIENLRKFVDTLVIIPNQKLLEVLPENTTMIEAFIHADDVLRKAIQGISDMIVVPALINLDFADVRSVMKKKGLAHMGIGEAEGPDRMLKAIRQAVMSPLLETNIGGSSGIILNITGGISMTLAEINKACKKVEEAVDESANIIFGAGIDENLGDKIQVTLIATGFGGASEYEQYEQIQQMNTYAPASNSQQMTNEQFKKLFGEEENVYNEDPKKTLQNSTMYEEKSNVTPKVAQQPYGNYTNMDNGTTPNADFGTNSDFASRRNFGYQGQNFAQNQSSFPSNQQNFAQGQQNFGQNQQVANQNTEENAQRGDMFDRDNSNIPAFLRKLKRR